METQNFDEIDRDIWVRKTKLLYPEVEDWVIKLAVDAWIRNEGKDVEYKKEEYEREMDKILKGDKYNPY